MSRGRSRCYTDPVETAGQDKEMEECQRSVTFILTERASTKRL